MITHVKRVGLIYNTIIQQAQAYTIIQQAWAFTIIKYKKLKCNTREQKVYINCVRNPKKLGWGLYLGRGFQGIRSHLTTLQTYITAIHLFGILLPQTPNTLLNLYKPVQTVIVAYRVAFTTRSVHLSQKQGHPVRVKHKCIMVKVGEPKTKKIENRGYIYNIF